MTSTQFTASHNGITDKRNSKTATYTHVIWCDTDDPNHAGVWQWCKSEVNAQKAIGTYQRRCPSFRYLILPVD